MQGYKVFGIVLLFYFLQKQAFSQDIKKLTFPTEKSGQAWVAPETAVNALLRFENSIYLLAQKKNTLIMHPFEPKNPPAKKFKNVTDTVRWVLPKDLNLTAWRALEKFKKDLILLEGIHLSLGIWSTTESRELHRFTIPRDMIKPNADAIGEPTAAEIKKARNIFSSEISILGNQPKFVGLAQVPPRYLRNDKAAFLVTTKLPHFPLIQIGCQDDGDLGSCMVKRKCDLVLPKGVKSSAIVGLAYSAKRDLFAFPDHDQKRIYTFSYASCSKIKIKNVIQVPDEVKSLSQIHIDQDDRLWVTSFLPDDKQDASVIYFEEW